jgi:hypothetical protein
MIPDGGENVDKALGGLAGEPTDGDVIAEDGVSLQVLATADHTAMGNNAMAVDDNESPLT